MKNKWICSDADTAQYYSQINDYSWAFVEARKCADGAWRACHAVVDIRDYTLDELWQYCSAYYDSFEQMVEDYGFREALHIMAECVFEQLHIGEMALNMRGNDRSKITEGIHRCVKNDNR